MNEFLLIVIMFFVSSVYCIPAIVATAKASKYETIIWVLNISLGWTILGWFALLVWVYFDETGVKT